MLPSPEFTAQATSHGGGATNWQTAYKAAAAPHHIVASVIRSKASRAAGASMPASQSAARKGNKNCARSYNPPSRFPDSQATMNAYTNPTTQSDAHTRNVRESATRLRREKTESSGSRAATGIKFTIGRELYPICQSMSRRTSGMKTHRTTKTGGYHRIQTLSGDFVAGESSVAVEAFEFK